MATSTELLRAAEHMRQRADAIARLDPHVDDFRRGAIRYSVRQCADELEREAQRLQAVEAQQGVACETCRRVGIRPGIPSWNDCAACGGHGRVFKSKAKRSWPEGGPSDADFARRKAAKNRRHAWARAVKIEMLETITISDPSSP